MLKGLILGVFFLSTSLFAQEMPQKRHFCKASHYAMDKLIDIYIPDDKVSCTVNDDCTFLSIVRWRKAVGMNKTALAAHRLMTNDLDYRYLNSHAYSNCTHNHPRIVFPLPTHSECVSNVCHAVFADGSLTSAKGSLKEEAEEEE